MKYSRQRKIILETVLLSSDHPNAEMIYNRVQKIIPNISLGTVYRNLNFLAENGNILKINMPTGDRFDKTIKPHCHIRCVKCNKVFDIDGIDISEFNIDSKYKIISVSINFEGICDKCQEQ